MTSPLAALAPDDAGRLLAVTRVGVGTGAWIASGLAGRVLGLQSRGGSSDSFVLRLFAVRDAVLGLGVLRSTGAERRHWLQLGMVADGADAAAAVVAGAQGRIPRHVAVASAIAAAGAVALAARALE